MCMFMAYCCNRVFNNASFYKSWKQYYAASDDEGPQSNPSIQLTLANLFVLLSHVGLLLFELENVIKLMFFLRAVKIKRYPSFLLRYMHKLTLALVPLKMGATCGASKLASDAMLTVTD